MAKPLEFPDWATNGFPTAIDQPFASLARIQVGHENADVPSPKMQNGLHFWTAAWLTYLSQRQWESVPLDQFQILGGAPTLSIATRTLNINPAEVTSHVIPQLRDHTIAFVRMRHVESGTSQLRSNMDGADSVAATSIVALNPLGPQQDFPQAATWIYDTFTPTAPIDAQEDRTVVLNVENFGAAGVLLLHKIEVSYDRI